MPVYLDTEKSRSHYLSDYETAKIHASVIKDIDSKCGELLFNNNQISVGNLERIPTPTSKLTVQIAHLDRELSVSYSDRDIKLINSLRRYLKRSTGEQETLVIGTHNFHNVWETMLDSCLPSKFRVNNKLPVPFYFDGQNYMPVAQKGQRTDTVIKSEDGTEIAVIGTKYYRAQEPNSAPGWPDIVKQICYKTAVESVVSRSANITLNFFPGDKKILHSSHVGPRTSEPVKMKPNSQYLDFHCHYYDLDKLMQDYVNGDENLGLYELVLGTI